MRPFIVLVYTFRTNSQRTSTEGWACGAGHVGEVDSICKELRAARWILVPTLITSAVLLGLVLWIKARSARECTKRKSPSVEDGELDELAEQGPQA